MRREPAQRDPAVLAAPDQPRERGHADLVEPAHERDVDNEVPLGRAVYVAQELAGRVGVEGPEEAEDAAASLDPAVQTDSGRAPHLAPTVAIAALAVAAPALAMSSSSCGVLPLTPMAPMTLPS